MTFVWPRGPGSSRAAAQAPAPYNRPTVLVDASPRDVHQQDDRLPPHRARKIKVVKTALRPGAAYYRWAHTRGERRAQPSVRSRTESKSRGRLLTRDGKPLEPTGAKQGDLSSAR